MTVKELKEILKCNEPDFEYHGKGYSICMPGDTYCIGSYNGQMVEPNEFPTLDDLLDKSNIEGKTLREILPEIDM